MNEKIPILDHGYVLFIEKWGSDERIVEAARMSTDKGFQGWGGEQTYKCNSCGYTLGEGLFDHLRFHGEHLNANGAMALNDGIAYCPNGSCLDETLVEHVSPAGDEKLLRYLWTHKHATPFEMAGMTIEVQAPIFVFREWHRHRTQCLTGDSLLIFSRPYNGSAYPLPIETVVSRMTKLRSANGIRQMNLRFRDDAGNVRHTHVKNAWASGEKKVYKITTRHGAVNASADHHFLTASGVWKPVSDLAGCEVYFCRQTGEVPGAVPPVFSVEELAGEVWKEILDGFDVSSLGRIRSYWAQGQHGLHRVRYPTPTLKKISVNEVGRAITGLPNGCGGTKVVQVSHIVAAAFIGEIGAHQVLHADDNPLNNRVRNLILGDAKLNAEQRVKHRRQTRLQAVPEKIWSISNAGTQPTYDVEVEASEHNFVANGFITHNSYNELSARYTALPDLFYVPSIERLQAAKQSSTNKQASDTELTFGIGQAQIIQGMIDHAYRESRKLYENLLSQGVAREVARVVIPVAQYSRMRASANLRNWLAFLTLRTERSAQFEIRQFAAEVETLVASHFPRTHELFRSVRWILEEK